MELQIKSIEVQTKRLTSLHSAISKMLHKDTKNVLRVGISTNIATCFPVVMVLLKRPFPFGKLDAFVDRNTHRLQTYFNLDTAAPLDVYSSRRNFENRLKWMEQYNQTINYRFVTILDPK